MELAEWSRRVAAIVRDLGDRRYQQRSWLGRDPGKVSSPGEMCCTLCDDLDFGELLNAPGLGWNAAQRAAALDLLAAIGACAVADDVLPPAEVLDHPDWVRVRASAKRLDSLLHNR